MENLSIPRQKDMVRGCSDVCTISFGNALLKKSVSLFSIMQQYLKRLCSICGICLRKMGCVDEEIHNGTQCYTFPFFAPSIL